MNNRADRRIRARAERQADETIHQWFQPQNRDRLVNREELVSVCEKLIRIDYHLKKENVWWRRAIRRIRSIGLPPVDQGPSRPWPGKGDENGHDE